MSRKIKLNLPPEILARLDGALDYLPRVSPKALTLDWLIEESVRDAEAWLHDAMTDTDLASQDTLDSQKFAARRVLYNLKVIEILARLKGKPQPSSEE